MSIVGPRPERPEIAAEYEKEMPEFRLRLQAKLGVEFGVAGIERYKKGRRSGKPPESSGRYPGSDLYLRDVLSVRTDRHAR